MAKRTNKEAAQAATPVAAAEPMYPFDEFYGVDTGGLIQGAALASGHPSDVFVTAYYGVAPSILRGVVARWQLIAPAHTISETTFLDIGAGKGRAMLVASQLGFREVIGVELNAGLARIARENIAAWQAIHAGDPTADAISPIRLLEGDALAVDLPRTPAVAFLFHPFEAPLLRKFLRRLEGIYSPKSEEPPLLDLLYVNAEHAAVLDFDRAFRRHWFGRIPMSPDDHAADLAAIATQTEYGSTGDEECGIYRLIGRRPGDEAD